jgi:hypothetical protein
VEIPITGFLHEHDGLGNEHSHALYITSWNGQPYRGPAIHVHPFKGVTSFDAGHNHKYVGVTEPAPSGVPHNHKYCTFTSFDDRHKHLIKGVTGPDIPLPGGGHIHHFKGVTTVDGDPPHTHKYSGETGR